MKLFQADIIDNDESETILLVAENLDEAEEKVLNMGWNCLGYWNIYSVDEVDGYKIILEKESK